MSAFENFTRKKKVEIYVDENNAEQMREVFQKLADDLTAENIDVLKTFVEVPSVNKIFHVAKGLSKAGLFQKLTKKAL